MAATFQELGIPFSLFDAPVAQASGYVGLSRCSLCERTGQPCFHLWIGCAVMQSCSNCGTVNGLDAYDRVAVPCRVCENHVPFPSFTDDDIHICYDCLRLGRAAMTQDTELGMISWPQAFDGVTHGLPGLDRADLDLISLEGGWTGARLPQETMFELLRTPTYRTIQGERWLFCCRHPMIYIGEWTRADFANHAPDGDGKVFFEQIVEDIVPGLWEDKLHDETGIYVFRCADCGRHRAHWDLA